MRGKKKKHDIREIRFTGKKTRMHNYRCGALEGNGGLHELSKLIGEKKNWCGKGGERKRGGKKNET